LTWTTVDSALVAAAPRLAQPPEIEDGSAQHRFLQPQWRIMQSGKHSQLFGKQAKGQKKSGP
jgi:hypothetical protein